MKPLAERCIPAPMFVILGALCFSTTGTAQALAPEGASPPVIGALRLLFGGAVMLLWCYRNGCVPHLGSWPVRATLLPAAGILLFQLSFFGAVARTGVAIGTVIASGFAPIAAGILGVFFLGEWPERAWYPATLLAIGGLACLSLGGKMTVDPVGVGLALMSGFSYALYMASSKKLTEGRNPATVMAVLFGVGALFALPILVTREIAWVGTASGLLVALHLGVIATAMAYTLTLTGLRHTRVATASTLGLAEPLAAALLGFCLLGEACTLQALAGIGLLCASTVILSRSAAS